MFPLLKDFLLKNKKNILFLVWFIFIYFTFTDWVFAEILLNKDWTLTADWSSKVATVFQWIWTIVTVFVSLLTYLATLFLSPEWINGSLFGLNAYFKQIWIMISNIVYLIFAFILIWIAFMNIIWKWWDKYQLKQALPKLIIWIIIVPFTWFLVQFILSLSAILTVQAINLPFETFSWFNTKLSEVKIPQKCYLNLTSSKTDKTTNWTATKTEAKTEAKTTVKKEGTVDTNSYFRCDPKKEGEDYTLGKVMESWNDSDSIFWVIATYTYWVLSLEGASNLTKFDSKAIGTIFDLAIKLIFDVLFIVVYAVLMIALWMVLLTRWIYIWIYIMISPLFWLMYFFDKTEWWWEFFDKFNIKQFISLALVPVYTMLALSFWLLFMFIVWQWMTEPNQSIDVISIVDGDEWSVISIWWDKGVGAFSLTVIWAPATKWLTNFADTVWNWALWVVWTLILKIFGIVVLWWAVMAALRTNDVTKAIVEPLHAFGTQVWWIVKSLPHHTPIPWVWSMSSMQQIAWKYSQALSNKSIKSATRLAGKLPFLWDNADVMWALEKINVAVKSNTGIKPQQLAELYKDLLKVPKWDVWIAKSTWFVATAKIIWEALNIKPEELAKFKNGNEQEIINTIMRPIEKKLEEGNADLGIIPGDGIGSTYSPEDFKKLLKDLHSWTATPHNSNNTTNNLNLEIPWVTMNTNFWDSKEQEKIAGIIYAKINKQLWSITIDEFKNKLESELLITDDNNKKEIIEKIRAEFETDANKPENSKLFSSDD